MHFVTTAVPLLDSEAARKKTVMLSTCIDAFHHHPPGDIVYVVDIRKRVLHKHEWNNFF